MWVRLGLEIFAGLWKMIGCPSILSKENKRKEPVGENIWLQAGECVLIL